ncbi:uncharacterized protein LOC121386408 [Gigantopelta aegis]|uniref:uncharacterized protein LOC121386408 n=1 Tax=Gigantopelta aegis TaxID=1735272 RepID=UPI001B8894AD|nr:uncharacterized protein LOC121386408 [Gigantopelta aegis]
MSGTEISETHDIQLETAASFRSDHQQQLLRNTSVSKKQKLWNSHLNSRDHVNELPVNPPSECFQKLISFCKEHCSIPRLTMFPCTDCAEHFVDAISRQIHVMQKHANLLFSCEVCRKIFATKSEKTRHIKSTHKKIIYYDNAKCSFKYPCKVCNKVEFDSFTELVSHSPCLQGAPQRSDKPVLQTLKRKVLKDHCSVGIPTKTSKTETKEDLVLVQDGDKFFSFDFLNDCDKTDGTSSDHQEKTVFDDKDVVTRVHDGDGLSRSICGTNNTMSEGRACPVLMSTAKSSLTSKFGSELESKSSLTSEVGSKAQNNIDDSKSFSVFQIDNNSMCTSSDLLEEPTDDRDSSGLMHFDHDNSNSATRFQNNSVECNSSNVLNINNNNNTCTSSSLLIHNEKDTKHDEDEERLRLSLCSVSEQNMSDCEAVLDTEVCGPGESYHFMEGGESWTISRNTDPDDAEPDSNTTLTNAGESELISSDGEKSPACLLNSERSRDSVRTCTDTSVEELQTGTYDVTAHRLVTDHCTPVLVDELSSNYAVIDGSYTGTTSPESVDKLSTNYAVVSVDGSYTDTTTHVSVDGPHASTSTTLSTDVLCTNTAVLVSTEELYNVSTAISSDGLYSDTCNTVSGYELYTDACAPASELYSNAGATVSAEELCTGISGAGLVKIEETASGLESCSLCHQVFIGSLQFKQHISLCHSLPMNEAVVADAEVEVNVADDSSCEVCDLCNEQFETLSQMKDHIVSVHAATCEVGTSLQSTAGVLNDVLHVTPTSQYVVEGTGSPEVVFAESKVFGVNMDSFCRFPEHDVKEDMLNNVNNLIMDDKTVMLHNNLDNETKDTKINNYSPTGGDDPKKKRKCVKRRSKLLECLESVSTNLLINDEDHVTNHRRYKTRQYVRDKTLHAVMASTEQMAAGQSSTSGSDSATKSINVDNMSHFEEIAASGSAKLAKTSSKRCDMDSDRVSKPSKDMLSCSHCRYLFFSCALLQQMHMERHHGAPAVVPVTIVKSNSNDIPFQCSQCHKVFKDERSLTVHTMLPHSKNYMYYPCDLCKKVFAYPGLKRRHMASIHYVRDCDTNNMARAVMLTSGSAQPSSSKINEDEDDDDDDFNSDLSALAPQGVSVSDKVFVPFSLTNPSDSGNTSPAGASADNDANFSSTDDSAVAASVGGSNVTDILQSDQCSYTTDSEQKMKSSRSLSSSNICKVSCSDTTVGVTNDLSNIMFPCKFCDNEFDTLKKLANHAINVHRSMRPSSMSNELFPCKFCGKEFSSLEKLGNHAVNAHSEDMPQARYPCECGKLFTTTSGLIVHLRYSCRLNRESAGQRPVQAPNNVKMFQCQFCDHWFLSPVHLKNHARRSHPSKVSLIEDQ